LLRDREPALCAELATAFEGIRSVEVSCGDIFDVTADAIVSPANSFGFMDGGIDLAYSRRFGWGLQARVREVLHDEHGGELPVGQAIVVATGDEVIRWLVCAPTMRVPDNVAESVNAYLAMRAALRAVRAFDAGAHPIESVLCPGLATAVGRMPFPRAALQMRAGFDAVMNALPPFVSLGQAKDAHFALLRTPQR
jgi:O-acetyl-ADP-ribose deacetylase (regulator of RNase III)